MRICIYETSHHETALAMLLLLEPEHAECTVFTSQDVAVNLRAAMGDKAEPIRWMIRKEDETPRAFISRMGTFCREHVQDLLLLETVEANHYPIARIISGLRHTRVVLFIHDVHSNFDSRLRPSIRGIVRHFGKKALLSRVNGFIALSSRVAGHLEPFVKKGLPVTWLPGAVFRPESYTPISLAKQSPLRLVVPGSYDLRRRDYEQVFQFATTWEALGMELHLDLLGGQGPDAARILERCSSWKGSHVHITAYGNGELPETEFAAQMQAAHFIWVPSVIRTTISDGIEEVYGLSKSSGNLFDAIRFARPLIVPEDLLVDSMQEPACCRYKTFDMMTDLLRNMTPEQYENHRLKALAVSEKYTVERIRERTPDIMQWTASS